MSNRIAWLETLAAVIAAIPPWTINASEEGCCFYCGVDEPRFGRVVENEDGESDTCVMYTDAERAELLQSCHKPDCAWGVARSLFP